MLKAIAKELTPPIVLRAVRNFRRNTADEVPAPRVGFFGDYPSYEAAMADCGPDYQSHDILEVTRINTLKIRDSSRAEVTPHLAPMLSSFFLAVADLGLTEITVTDFGGAMGGHYFHVRRLLPERYALRWRVVDLPRTAQIGQETFGNTELSFSDELDTSSRVDVVVASGVFQVLPNPHEAIETLLSTRARHFIFPLIPISEYDTDRLTVEYVSPTLAEMSIPHWFFSRSSIEQSLANRRRLSSWRHAEYTNPLDGRPCEYFGYHLVS
jgi:putative methyltransferase (TIGR04325 family)